MNEALLLIGHGSSRYPDAGAPMRRHADALRETHRFAQVEIGLLNGEPSVAAAVARITAPNLRVIPFFMEDGYFVRVAVPRALGARPYRLAPPIGIHAAMSGLIERQAIAACQALGVPPHEAAVLVIGHGSASAPGRSLALHRHSAELAAKGRFAVVQAACLEEAPFVADALRALRAYPVVAIGFFANRGGHVRDDVPNLIAREQAARGNRSGDPLGNPGGNPGPVVRFAACVADDAAITEIILDHAE